MNDTINEQVNTKMSNVAKLLGSVIESNYGVLVARQFDNIIWWTKHYKWKVEHGLIDESTAKRLLGEREALCFTSQRIPQEA